MAAKSVLNKDIYGANLAGSGSGYGSVTKVKPIMGGTYSDGISTLTPTMPKVPTNIKQNLNVKPVNSLGGGIGGTGGGVTKEGVVTGGLGVTKMPTINMPTSTQGKYSDYLSTLQAKTTLKTGNNAQTPTTVQKTAAANVAPQNTATKQAANAPAPQSTSATETPATYEEYLSQQRDLLDKRKADADRQAEAAKERAAVDAQASYAQNMATYGTNAETMAQMGLQGGGYSDYINAQAHAQKRADVQQANVTEQAAKAQNNATYEDALAELNKSELEYKERQQEKAEAKQEKTDSIYASLWERAIDPDSNYTEENIESLGREYGLPDSQIEELKNVIRASKNEKNGNVYANLLGYANEGTYNAEQIAAIAKEKGLSEQQIKDLTAAATTYKNNTYKANYSSFMGSIESGSMTKNILDTALKNDTITQEQYNDLLNKFQTSFYDEYSSQITANFSGTSTDSIDKSLQRGEITQAQYDDLRKKYNASVSSAITAASLFYQNGVKLDENTAKAMVENMKKSGWLDDENKSTIDGFLSGEYKEEDGGCFAKGTLITIADGSQIPVEELKAGDNVLVFNHTTGETDIAPVSYIFYDGVKNYDVLKLHFEDKASIEVLFAHGFFDTELKKYVIIDPDNAKDYIGHKFYRVVCENGEYKKQVVTLTDFEIYSRETECYSVLSAAHVNNIVNGMLAVTDDIKGLYNIFELDDDYKYDAERMAADIEKYGLFTYDDWKDYATEEQFAAFNGEYLKVAIGKGLVTVEELIGYINRFLQS